MSGNELTRIVAGELPPVCASDEWLAVLASSVP